MKKNIIFVSLLVSTCILTSCFNSWTTDKDVWENIVEQTDNTSESKTQELSQESGEKLIEDTLESWWKLTCSMEALEDWIWTSWVVYIDGDNKQFYGEIDINLFWEELTMYFLKQWEYQYTWGWLSDIWEKFLYYEDMSEDDYLFLEDEWEYEDDGIRYICERWMPWDITFTLPDDIEFYDEDEYPMDF